MPATLTEFMKPQAVRREPAGTESGVLTLKRLLRLSRPEASA
jgi:hypothetical protein